MRLFVAIEVPDPARGELTKLAGRLAATGAPVRWAERVGFHLTLKFLGEVDEGRLGEVKAAVDRAVSGVAPFEAMLRHVGGYPSIDHPRVIWVGAEGPPALTLLAEHVEREMQGIGFAREPRPFSAHVTLGRTREGHQRRRPRKGRAPADESPAALVDAVGREAATFVAGTVRIERVTLFESRLERTGAVYAARHEAVLEG